MKRPTEVSSMRKIYLPLLLFLTLWVNLCHGNKDKVGIIYDVSTELLPSVTEEQVNAFSSTPHVQIFWLLMNSSSPTYVLGRVQSFIGSGIHVLISQLRYPQLTSVSAMTETLQIPHLALDIDTCRFSPNETYTIHLEHQFHNVPQMIVSIAQLERWKKVILITNNNLVPRYAQHFIPELSKAGIESLLWNGEDIQPWTERCQIFVIVKHLNSFQQMVNSTKPIPGHRRWIVLSDGDVKNSDLSFLPEGWLLIKAKVPCLYSETFYFCNNTRLKFLPKQLLKILLSTGLDLRSYKNNMTKVDRGQESFCVGADYLLYWIKQKLRLLRQSKTKIIKDVCSGKFELFKSSKDSESIQVAGEWTPTEGLSMYGGARSPLKEDFGGVIIRVGVMTAAIPISFVTIGEIKNYQGLAIDILDHVAMDLNFRCVLVEPADGFYGHPLDNGTWTGIIGMVYRKEIVFGVELFTVDMERSEVVDFTIPFMDNSFSILTPKPARQTCLFQFAKSFSTRVWVLIFLFGISTAITLIIMIGLTQHKRNADNQIPSKMDIVFDVIAAFLEQGVQCWPRSTSARCLLAFWFFFSLLIVAIYTAHLTAVLTVSTPVKHIESLKDLSERTELSVFVLAGTSTWRLFQSSKDPVYQTIFSRMVAAPASQEDILQKVMSGSACYISNRVYLQYLVALSCGQVRIAEEKFQRHINAFPIQKNSPFKKAIDHSLLKMMEAGFIDSLKKKWLDRFLYCNKGPNEKSTINMLNIYRLRGVFLMFIGFVALALLYYVVERILFHVVSKRKSVC